MSAFVVTNCSSAQRGPRPLCTMHYVYVLKNNRDDLYIGYTDDLDRRLKEHQKREDQTYQLIYYEAYLHENQARNREQKLKYYGSAWRGLKSRILA